jgi:3-isopropylmalate dehydrogenase
VSSSRAESFCGKKERIMRFLVLPCDGIGPEITKATMEVVEAANARFNLGLSFDYDDVGFTSLEKYGTTLRDETIEKAKGYDGIILGPQSHMDYPPRDQGGPNVSGGFRVRLDLYANVRPARSRSFLPGKKMDLVIMREATEGFYPDRNMFKGIGEFMPTEDVALSVRKLTSKACERIARAAFELAMKRGKKVTAVHKANNFIITDGFFMDWVRKVHKDYPEVTLNDVIIDAMAAHLVRDPSRYDVIVSTNFYSDILSDLASELSGSLGLAGSINANAESGLVCAQAQHGSAPDIQGQNIANPTSLILSAAMMIGWLGERRNLPAFEAAAAEIDRAVDAVLANPETRTRDLGGTMNTDDFGSNVAREVAAPNLAKAG